MATNMNIQTTSPESSIRRTFYMPAGSNEDCCDEWRVEVQEVPELDYDPNTGRDEVIGRALYIDEVHDCATGKILEDLDDSVLEIIEDEYFSRF